MLGWGCGVTVGGKEMQGEVPLTAIFLGIYGCEEPKQVSSLFSLGDPG